MATTSVSNTRPYPQPFLEGVGAGMKVGAIVGGASLAARGFSLGTNPRETLALTLIGGAFGAIGGTVVGGVAGGAIGYSASTSFELAGLSPTRRSNTGMGAAFGALAGSGTAIALGRVGSPTSIGMFTALGTGFGASVGSQLNVQGA